MVVFFTSGAELQTTQNREVPAANPKLYVPHQCAQTVYSTLLLRVNFDSTFGSTYRERNVQGRDRILLTHRK